jgi:5-methylcytosine-specific restriction endonuclease McrA
VYGKYIMLARPSVKFLCMKQSVGALLRHAVPAVQRRVDDVHVRGLVTDVLNDWKRYGELSVLQSITLARCAGSLYVLDGQHRLLAFQELVEVHDLPLKEVLVDCVVYECESVDELAERYNTINKNKPVHPLEVSSSHGKTRSFLQWMKETWPAYWSSSSKCVVPHLNMGAVMTALQQREAMLSSDLVTSDSLSEATRQLNEHLRRISVFQMSAAVKKSFDKCVAKSKGDPCFLSIFRSNHDWLDLVLYRIVHGVAYPDNVFEIREDARKRPSEKLRRQVWEKVNSPKDLDDGECYCCQQPLTIKKMECGHVVPHVLGGEASLANLMPVCRACNLAMGICNLEEWKRINFEHR